MLTTEQHAALSAIMLDTDQELMRLRSFARMVLDWQTNWPKTALLMTPAEIKQSELDLNDIIDTFRTEAGL